MALKNGQLPNDVLVTVGKDYYGRPARFRPEAAASWERMRALGMPMDVSDTYRDLARQKEYEKNPPNGAKLAAKAGTSSHGWGLAVDARGACLTWLKKHGTAHGWVQTIAIEHWHFEYFAALDQHAQENEMSEQLIMNAFAKALTQSAQVARELRRIIWIDTKVQRSAGAVSALQELADAKSAAQRAEAKVDAVLAVVRDIPGVDTDALAATVAEAVAEHQSEVVTAAVRKGIDGATATATATFRTT